MFIKIANNRKKIINTALAAGYRPKRVSPQRSTLISNFIRVENNVVSNISVSYRKNDPAVKIQHFHTNGKREEIERILLSKRTWDELMAHIHPRLVASPSEPHERKQDQENVRNLPEEGVRQIGG